MTEPKIIVALDSPKTVYLSMFEELDPNLCRIKIGKSLFTRHGLAVVKAAQNYGFDVFLDLKYHDIPNTVADAVEAAADLGVWMMNLHASGGRAMMEAARERLINRSDRPILVAVTVLTSLSGGALSETMGVYMTPYAQVLHFTKLAYESGMDGIVCSPQEVGPICTIERYRPHGFVKVVPGIRPAGASLDDQARTATPKAAIDAGATYLVIGRPITQSETPGLTLERIVETIK